MLSYNSSYIGHTTSYNIFTEMDVVNKISLKGALSDCK